MKRNLIKAAALAAQFRELRAVSSPGSRRASYAAYALRQSAGVPGGVLVRQTFRVEGGNGRAPTEIDVDVVARPSIFNRISGASGDVGELYIYETIGFDCFAENGGLTANKVKDALDEMKGVKSLNVFINSEGGDVFEAKSIYSQLQRFDAEKVVHIDGIAASAATLIAMAGDRIVTSPVATWMVHEAWSGAMGNAADMRKIADLLDLENQTIAETYARRTGGELASMLDLMAAETWMNAATALELGFTDEIAEPDPMPMEPDEGDQGDMMTNKKTRSVFAVAAAVTQSRLNSVTTSELMSARLAMHRTRSKLSSGQPDTTRTPASR